MIFLRIFKNYNFTFFREIMLEEYDNETDDSSAGSIKFVKGNVLSTSSIPLIKQGQGLNNTQNSKPNTQNKLIDDIGDIFGISSGPTQKTASNDMGFLGGLGGLDLTQGNNIIGIDSNFNGQNNSSNNKVNSNDLLSSLGAVR